MHSPEDAKNSKTHIKNMPEILKNKKIIDKKKKKKCCNNKIISYFIDIFNSPNTQDVFLKITTKLKTIELSKP